MANLKRYLKYNSKTANVPRILENAKRKLAKHIKKHPLDKKAAEYLGSI